MPLDKKIDKLLEIIGEIFVSGAGAGKASGFELWPFHPIYGRLFFTKVWFERFIKLLKEIEKKGFTIKEIAKTFKAPSQITQFFWMLDGIKQSDLSIEERLEITQKLFDFLAVWRQNIFCEDGKNLIWDEAGLSHALSEIKFINLERKEELKRDLYRLESGLWLYAEMINFENHPLAHSFQGPYQWKDKVLVVKKYFNLRPEFWEFTKNLNFVEIEIYELYKKGTNIEFGFFERGIRSTEDYRGNLKGVAIKVNDEPIALESVLPKALSSLSSVITQGSTYIQNLNHKELLVQCAGHWFNALKPLCDLIGDEKNYKVPQEVHDNIYKRYERFYEIWEKIEAQRKHLAKLPPEEQIKIANKIFDPRIP